MLIKLTFRHVRNSFIFSAGRVLRARHRINDRTPLAASVCKHDRRERRYLATPPRAKSSVTLKGKSTRTVHPFGFKSFAIPATSLANSLPCANTLLYGRPLLEMRKSQISILGARTVAHYQRYTLCLRLNTPSRFVSRSRRGI